MAPAARRLDFCSMVAHDLRSPLAAMRLRIDLARREADVEVSVSDEGRGIAEDQVGQLFQRYSRPGTSGGLPGTDLSLMIVRETVTAHRGTCGVRGRRQRRSGLHPGHTRSAPRCRTGMPGSRRRRGTCLEGGQARPAVVMGEVPG